MTDMTETAHCATTSKIPVVRTVIIHDFEIKCPSCGVAQRGWVSAPFKCVDVCDACGQQYAVAAELVYEFRM